jgi:hypothetical protein
MNTDTHTIPAQRTLGAIVESAARLKEVSKAELNFGDCVQVTTRNSTYLIQVLEEGLYLISGGWVDLQGESPMKTTIAGCTWGGSAIKADIVAACGLHLEFGERVVTSTIQKVFVIRHTGNQVVH